MIESMKRAAGVLTITAAMALTGGAATAQITLKSGHVSATFGSHKKVSIHKHVGPKAHHKTHHRKTKNLHKKPRHFTHPRRAKSRAQSHKHHSASVFSGRSNSFHRPRHRVHPFFVFKKFGHH